MYIQLSYYKLKVYIITWVLPKHTFLSLTCYSISPFHFCDQKPPKHLLKSYPDAAWPKVLHICCWGLWLCP